MFTWSELNDNHEKRREIKKTIVADVRTLESVYAANIDMYSCRPDETISEFIRIVGFDNAAAAVATLVNRSADDGRISKNNIAWAAGVAGSVAGDAAVNMFIYTDRIHMGHLNQLADILRKTDDKKDTAATRKPEAERPETISPIEEKEEENTMDNIYFAADAVTVYGKKYPAEYSVSTDSVTVFLTIESDIKKVRYNADHPDYAAVRAAAEAAAEAWKARRNAGNGIDEQPEAEQPETVSEVERPETISEAEPVDDMPEETAEQPEAVTEEAAEAAAAESADAAPVADGKAPRGPVPEKSFIGETITGKGWKIVFDGDENRTRVFFDEQPKKSALKELNIYGFYFSNALNSWNKKLTFKAYRNAWKLAARLAALYL